MFDLINDSENWLHYIYQMEGSDLPIIAYQKEIVSAIQKERAVVISGKTGCGKSTKVPQFILDY